MNTERWQKIRELFDAALAVEREKRAEFLGRACDGDDDLRREVEKLLASFESDASFMEKPAVEEVASLILEKEAATSQTDGNRTGGFVAGTILNERYRIIGLLGKGGMGEVYKAEDLKLDQTVALKFLPDRLEKNEAALKRFVGEVRIARQVAHGNVCKVFDIGESDGRHFLSMEYIEGDDLSNLLRRIGRLPSDKAVEIGRQLCFGLQAIHDAGILHRDLKPANVIIDNRGKARITDFGIAGLEAELQTHAELRVGTPAYMSPEQITGSELNVKSDIYSLGLVLYEMLTGKQAFEADSVRNLIKKHQSETPTNPSAFVRNIDPLVEQVIFRCLEKNPENRPVSALQVALALPGGNPLEAAIAAGETPSPEMVAAAPKKGALKPPVAVALLVAVILSIAYLALISKQFALHRLVPLEKSPEVLRERARNLAENFGYPGNDSYYGFFRESFYLQYVVENDKSPARWQKLMTGQPAAYRFSYRQSLTPLVPFSSGVVNYQDPPNNVSGMVQINLDTRGRLILFDAVPSRIDGETKPAPANFDWAGVFKEAGLNINDFTETASLWSPPRAFDERRAWSGKYPEPSDIPIRIEASAYRGQLVQFQIVEPWTQPEGQTPYQGGVSRSVDGLILLAVFFTVMFIGGWLAIRNVRGGRSDLRGAARVSVFLFALYMLSWAFVTHHVASTGEIWLFLEGLKSGVFWAFFVGLLYLAFEPFLRKHAPERVISWNRLLAGDWRDPLVGRDILIGGVIGTVFMAAASLRYLVPMWLGELPPMPYGISNPGGSALLGVRGFPVLFLNQTGASLVSGFMISFLVLFFSLLLRRKIFGSAAVWLLVFIFGISGGIAGGAFSGSLIYAVLFPTALVLSAARFGVLATVSMFLFYHIVVFYPFTTELSAWYAGDFLLCVAVLIALAIYGFYTSLAGEKIFQGGFFDED